LLLLLPIGFHLLTFLHFAGSGKPDSVESGDWRRGFILATVLSGVVVAASAELLSLFGALNLGGVTIVWVSAVLIALWIGWRAGTVGEGLRRLRAEARVLDAFERPLVLALAALVLVLLLVGWMSPPNNVDSHIYHMSKVVHWAQNQSLRHYAAINHAQLIRPPWAELAILHLRTLFGSDRPANLVQWFSMVGSVVGVSAITALLGGTRKTQLLAAAVAFSVPMGILQSTSTQNDYAVCLWVVILSYMVLLGKKRKLLPGEILALGSSVGLGMLTKGTFFAYAAPLLIWLLAPMLLSLQIKRLLVQGTAIGVAAVVLNAGFWSRNVATYGGPYGPSDVVRMSLGRVQSLIPGLVLPPSAPDSTESIEGAPAGDLASSSSPPERGGPVGQAIGSITRYGRLLLGMAGWNLITPSSAVNAIINQALRAVPSIFGNNYLFLIQLAAWNHEDTAGNPLHLFMIGFVLLTLVATRFRRYGRPCLSYSVAVVAAYILLPAVSSAAAYNWGLRYQLPFFVLAAPVVACGLSSTGSRNLPGLAAGLFLISALPYLILNNTRPVIGKTPWPTRVRSVFVAPPQEILLAMAPEARESFTAVADAISEIACTRVGLRIDSGDLEYAFWWLLDAPQSGTRIEVLYPLSSLNRYVDRSFIPCAIVCSICNEERMSLNGLELVSANGPFKLYAGSTFSWE